MKLALGTVQFGLDYGISNKRGKIPRVEALEILKYAIKKGIDTIDTAQAYGNSEEQIGEFMEKNGELSHIKVVTKISPKEKISCSDLFNESLQKLRSKTIYACLLHDFESFKKNESVWEVMQSLKKARMVKKIGFSLYHPSELEYLLRKKIDFDIVQVPFSIFDQRFSNLFPRLNKRNIEIHIRSVFLQGLVFKKSEDLTGIFATIREKIEKLNSISKELNIPISALCINFAILNIYINKVVIGVDSISNLRDNINTLTYKNEVESVYERLVDLREDDERIILPINWAKRI